MAVNSIAISGVFNSGALKKTANSQVCEFWIEVPWSDRDGNPGPATLIRCEAWGQRAEFVMSLNQGAVLVVLGELGIINTEDEGVRSQRAIIKSASAQLIAGVTEPLPINHVGIGGRMGRDGELQHWESGAVSFKSAIAVDVYKSENPDWFNFTLWRRSAEVANQYLRKGSAVWLCGQLAEDRWNDRATGKERRGISIKAERWSFMGGKSQDQDQGYDQEARQPRQGIPALSNFQASQPQPTPKMTASVAARTQTQPDDDYDDLPF